jgi:hypothetical protein
LFSFVPSFVNLYSLDMPLSWRLSYPEMSPFLYFALAFVCASVLRYGGNCCMCQNFCCLLLTRLHLLLTRLHLLLTRLHLLLHYVTEVKETLSKDDSSTLDTIVRRADDLFSLGKFSPFLHFS